MEAHGCDRLAAVEIPATSSRAHNQSAVQTMKTKGNSPGELRDGAQCKVTGGTHEGKSGTVRDIKTGKTGHVSITVVQANGERFKTLARNVVIQ